MPKYKLYHVEKDQYRLLTAEEIAQIPEIPEQNNREFSLSAEELNSLFLHLFPPSLKE